MKHYALLPLIALAFAALPVSVPAAPSSPLKPVPMGDVRITGGFWKDRLLTNARVTVWHNLEMCEKTGRLRNFDRAAGKIGGEHEGLLFNDSDVYKVLEAAAYSLQQIPDPELERSCDEIIARIAAAQQPDGYLYTYYTNRKELHLRHTNEAYNHETYCAGHLIEAAVAYHQATGKRTFLDVAIRLADYYDRLYGPDKKRDAPGHEEIEMALVRLYRHTGEKRYLDLARFFIDERGNTKSGRPMQGEYSQDHIPVREQREIQGHAVRAMYLYCGVADVAAITGDAGYLRTMDVIWPDVVNRKMYITGGIGPSGSNEGFTTAYDLPNDASYAESCAAIALMMWNQRMTVLYGEAKYADVVERALYNNVLAGISLEGNRYNYVNPHGSRGGHSRSEWFECACCPPNLARAIASVGSLVYSTTDDSIYVHHFLANTGKMNVGGRTVSITQETKYPHDGVVRLALTTDKPARFTLRLRVPGWAQGTAGPEDLYRYAGRPAKGAVSVKINGKPAGAYNISKGYALLDRTWKTGDVVEYDIPMLARRVYSNPGVKYNAGRVALQRGPIVYCLEDIDNANTVRRAVIPPDAPINAAWRPDLLNGVTVLTGTAVAQPTLAEGPKRTRFTAVPYYAWNNRDRGAMALWIPESEDALPGIKPPTIASKSRLSWSNMHANPSAPNDQLEPLSSNDAETPHMDWWPRNGTTEWLQYDFAAPATVSGSEVYFFQDHPHGGCALPAEWRIEYRDGDAWKPVENASAYPVAQDRFNSVTFAPVRTDGLRLVITSKPDLSSGVYEWKVTGIE